MTYNEVFRTAKDAESLRAMAIVKLSDASSSDDYTAKVDRNELNAFVDFITDIRDFLEDILEREVFP